MMSQNMENREAIVLGRYLVFDTIPLELQERYYLGLQYSNIQEDESLKHFEKALKNPWMLPYFDAAYALTKPNCLLRKRIFLMLAIVESSTDYCHLFLQNDARIIDYIKFAAIGLRSIFRALAGLIFLKLL